MELGLVLALFTILAVLGYYAALRKHPTDPHQDFFFDLTRRCLPPEHDGEIDKHPGGSSTSANEQQPVSQEEPVHVGFH